MRRFILSATLALAIAAPARAQHPASLSDSIAVGERLYARLFEDIALDSASARKAKQLILRTFVQQTNVGFVIAKGTWMKVVELQEQRDSALVAMVPVEARAIFLERARKTRPRHHFYEWPEP
jgi:hypothetical protein